MKKWISCILCGLLAASSFAGCGKAPASSSEPSSVSGSTSAPAANENLTAPGTLPIVKDQITLKVTCRDWADKGPAGELDFFKWYEKETNIHVEFTEIPDNALKEKINLSLVSGNLPDVYLNCGITNAQQIQYGSRGAFISLNSLIEAQGYEINHLMEDFPLMLDAITAPDGNIYALPTINSCVQCEYPNRTWINKTWLDAVGMDVPKTTADFELALQAFKDMDPNGNGKADEIPMMGSTNAKILPILMQSFTFTQDLYLDDNGKVLFGPNQEAYRKGLEWINSLVEKGLVDPSSLTQASDQFRAVLANPEAVVVGVPVCYNLPGDYNQDIERIKQYVALPALEGPDGVCGMAATTGLQPIVGGNFVITKQCKEPEAAFRWADAWYSEEATLNSWYGFEGVARIKPEQGTGLNGKPAVWTWTKEGYDSFTAMDPEQKMVAQNVFGALTSDIRYGELFDECDPNAGYKQAPFLHISAQEVYAKYGKPQNTLPALFFTEEESSEYTNLNTQITDYVDEQSTLFILGEKDTDKDWDSYIKEYGALNLDRYLELVQNAYTRQYGN